MADWASLLPELVQEIANCVLFTTTGGISAYMDMRDVCPSWRSAIAKPSPLAAVADLCFRPQHWVIVDQNPEDHSEEDDNVRLFFNVLTGRFRSMRMPVLHDQIIFGASNGLLVLHEENSPFLTAVLNPLTGDMLHFPATIHEYIGGIVSTSVSGVSHSTLVLWWGTGETVEFAGPTSDVFMEKDIDTCLMSMVAFQGNNYYVDLFGRVFKIVGPPEQFRHELIAQVTPDVDICLRKLYCSALVDSDGELLLVRVGRIAMKVFKVDVKRRLLEEVKSLGRRRALFLGEGRSLSVDAGNLPSIDGDCIYMSHMLGTSDTSRTRPTSHMLGTSDTLRTRPACVYDLMEDRIEIISRDYYNDRPFSLIHVLLNYCDFSYMI